MQESIQCFKRNVAERLFPTSQSVKDCERILRLTTSQQHLIRHPTVSLTQWPASKPKKNFKNVCVSEINF